MASRTGSIGVSGEYTSLANPVSLGVILQSGEVPTKIELTMGGTQEYGMWANNSNSTYTMDLYLVYDDTWTYAIKLGSVSLGLGRYASPREWNISPGSSLSHFSGKELYLRGKNVTTGATSSIRIYGVCPVTVTTQSASNTLTVVASPSAGGTVTGGGSYSEGDSVAISASPNVGYTFSGWTATSGTFADATALSTTFTMPSGNATATANFNHPSYTLSKAASPTAGGTVTIGATSGYEGSTIAINAVANSGYVFNGWTTTRGTIADINSASTTITMGAGNAKVTAKFAQNAYTVTGAITPANSGIVNLGAASGDSGDVISIQAVPFYGYKFSKWTVSGGTVASTTSALTTLTLSGNATVTAKFVAVNRSVVSSSAGNGTVTAINSTYRVGSVINVSATPNSGYIFDRWSSNAGSFIDPFSSSTQFIVPDEASTITGYFKIDPAVVSQAGYYNGSTWDPIIAMYYDGTDWIECVIKRYNGSSWDDVDAY